MPSAPAVHRHARPPVAKLPAAAPCRRPPAAPPRPRPRAAANGEADVDLAAVRPAERDHPSCRRREQRLDRSRPITVLASRAPRRRERARARRSARAAHACCATSRSSFGPVAHAPLAARAHRGRRAPPRGVTRVILSISAAPSSSGSCLNATATGGRRLFSRCTTIPVEHQREAAHVEDDEAASRAARGRSCAPTGSSLPCPR